MTAAYSDEYLLGTLAAVVRRLGHIPTYRELRLLRRTDPSLPNEKVFQRLAGTKGALIASLAGYCRGRPEFESVLALCQQSPAPKERAEIDSSPVFGEVYLIKSGRYYKIGRSNSAGRRTYELQIQLPERATRVHMIRTDDPVGIERYWHERFADKRGNGEWFKLDASDVSAFRRRKFM